MATALRPWRDIARELINEPNPQKSRELMRQLSDAYEQQRHLDDPASGLNTAERRLLMGRSGRS